MNETFGNYVKELRESKGLTLRGFAQKLDVSAPYVSDVEKGRRGPFSIEYLEKMVTILKLNETEKETLFDIAGQAKDDIAPDLPAYMKGKSYISTALRLARDTGAGEEEWNKFIEALKEREG